MKEFTTTAVTPLLHTLRMGGRLSERKREQRGEESIIEALAVQMSDVFYSEILPKLDLISTLNLAQVSKRCNDAVWSVDRRSVDGGEDQGEDQGNVDGLFL